MSKLNSDSNLKHLLRMKENHFVKKIIKKLRVTLLLKITNTVRDHFLHGGIDQSPHYLEEERKNRGQMM